ncbi:MAG: nascent polypeptide-associated complex protein [Candidatus Micrarchaeota archaeon]
MFPGMGMNPKQMQKLMEQMGIKTEEINSTRVIIEKEDGKIIITQPSVVAINMQGQKTFQIGGKIEEVKGTSAEPEISEDDIKLIMEQASVGREDAMRALKESKGDIAEALMKLKTQ